MNHIMATAATASARGGDHSNQAAGGGGGGGVLQGQIISHRVMERPNQEQIQLQQQPLKCPRCDSTNTKFCYYNNYSLSQPRHFCKACKRYWTRGGTLRNVPVGGGCRKNKRFRRPIIPPPPPTSNSFNSNCASSSSPAAASCSTSTPNTTSAHVLGGGGVSTPAVLHDAMNHHQFNPMFYGGGCGSLISDHHHQINFPFSRYDDLPHQRENLGLGFSSSSASGFISSSNYNPKQILQDLAASNYHTSFGSNSNGTTATTLTTTISSLLFGGSSSSNSALGGGLKDNLNSNNFQSFLPFEDQQNMQMHVKMENGLFGLRNTTNSHNQNQNGHHDMVISSPSSDPSSLMWSGGGTHASTNWLDPSSNVGSSSVPLL